MEHPSLYIISGCNGAGKTTASITVLPEVLQCNEFVNADEIAKIISPMDPHEARIEAGRMMIDKISQNLKTMTTFAFETTLATKCFSNVIREAHSLGYLVSLLYFWLDSPELAIARVKQRVASGGHDIPNDVIKRRYYAGIKNLFKLYMPICDYWMVFDNSSSHSEQICEGHLANKPSIFNENLFVKLRRLCENEM
jgi:predicted ABC-type ATPase